MILQTIQGLASWQICLLATGILLEGAIFAVVPEEVVSITMGLLWSQGKVDFIPALLAIQAGLLPANAIMVFIGSRAGARFLKNRERMREAVEEALAYFRRYGAWMIMATRFTPVVRAPIYIAAGVSRFGVLRFMKFDFLASLIQVPALMLLGRAIGDSAESVTEAYKKIGYFAGGLLAFIIIVTLILERRRVLRHRKAQLENAQQV